MPFPLLFPLLAGTELRSMGGAALQGLPAIIRTPEERENAERIKALQGHRGLTAAQRAAMGMELTTGIEGAQQAAQRQAAGALSNAVSGSGDALRQAQAARGQQIDATRDAAGQIAQADTQQRAMDDQELADRLSFQSQTRRARVGAIAGIPAAGLKANQQRYEEAQQLGRQGGPEGVAVDRATRIAQLSPTQLEQLRTYMQAQGLDVSILPPPTLPADDLFANRMSGRPY